MLRPTLRRSVQDLPIDMQLLISENVWFQKRHEVISELVTKAMKRGAKTHSKYITPDLQRKPLDHPRIRLSVSYKKRENRLKISACIQYSETSIGCEVSVPPEHKNFAITFMAQLTSYIAFSKEIKTPEKFVKIQFPKFVVKKTEKRDTTVVFHGEHGQYKDIHVAFNVVNCAV